MNTVIVKVNTPGLIAQVATIAENVWHEYYSSLLPTGQINYMVDKFQSVKAIDHQVKNEGYRYYLLQAGGEYAGYFAIKPGSDKLFLSKFYILQQYRGKGVSSAGFVFMEQTARNENLKSIWLTVNKGNDNSIAVYNHKGFKTVREQVADIGSGYVMDDYIMEKQLV